MEKVLVGLSGGVDSSVTACIVTEEYGRDNVTGVTMKLWNGKYKGGSKDACFSQHEDDDIKCAERLCQKLGIQHLVIDCSEEYDNTIINYFRNSYKNGETPNPCIRCNAEFKFGLMPNLAKKFVKFDKFATGHYCRIKNIDGKYTLQMARNKKKDQSYFLSRLSQEQLITTLFPIGEIETKDQVREIARIFHLDVSEKDDSMDFYSGEINELLRFEPRIGDIVDLNSNIIGKHLGYWHYTIGQRHGLNISSKEPLYVVDIKPCQNRIVVGNKTQACCKSFKLKNINWFLDIKDNSKYYPIKIRSNGNFLNGKIIDNEIILEKEAFGVTPGQTAVVYTKQTSGCIVCSGIIYKE